MMRGSSIFESSTIGRRAGSCYSRTPALASLGGMTMLSGWPIRRMSDVVRPATHDLRLIFGGLWTIAVG